MIKRIDALFSRIIKKYKIKAEKDVSSGRFLAIAGKMGGKKVIFKLRRARKFSSKNNFAAEIFADKALKSLEGENKKFEHRKIIDYSLDFPQWMIFEYKEGEKAACENPGRWCLSKNFYKANTPQKFFEILNFWRKDATFFIKNSKSALNYKFKKYNFQLIYADFINASNFYLEKHIKNYKIRQIYFKNDKSTIGDILKKFRKIIEENNKYICHGDLNPNNMLIYNGKTVILDLETVHLDLPYNDFIFIWFAGWNNLKWREKIFKLFLEDAEDKELFKTLFYISLLRFLPKILGNIAPRGKNDKSLNKALDIIRGDYEKARDYLLKVKL